MQVTEDHASFDYCMTSVVIVMNDLLDPIQLVGGEHDAAKSDPAGNRAGAGARDGNRGPRPRCLTQNLRDFVDRFWKDNALSETSAHVRRVGKERLDFV